MKIENLTRKQAKEVLNAVKSWIEDGGNANDLQSKIEKALCDKTIRVEGYLFHPTMLSEFLRVDETVVLSDLTSEDVDVLLKVIDEEIGDLREVVDASVGEVDAIDGTESIKNIREHLKEASEKAESVELLEKAKETIEAQIINRIIKEKDEEIEGLKRQLSSARSDASHFRARYESADRHIYELRRELECRYGRSRGYMY